MKRSSLITIIVLIALIIGSIFIFKKKGGTSTLDEDSRNFKVKDTTSITKIFMADKNGKQCTVVRTPKGWMVNDKFYVRPDAILTLLETIKSIEVKHPVAKQAKEAALKILAYRAIKVEIYAKDELIKQYYVDHETADGEGTHMLLTDIESGDNYADPFIVFIPGFTGYLNTRYIVEEKFWRNLSVINFSPDQLKRIEYSNMVKPDSSFVIDIITTKKFELSDHKGNKLPFEELNMKQYLAYFLNLNCEAIFTNSDKPTADSLSKKGKPFASFTLTDKNDKKYNYFFYFKPTPSERNLEYGVRYKYDPDRLYVNFDDKKEWATIQYFVFAKLFITTEYFKAIAPVKK
ncbi:MAG: hypothetical protein IPI93_00570 [Sphingobacteriaceae bacterium]|nr:hypothetical protein [Sphingobacteriaceae bacterium]